VPAISAKYESNVKGLYIVGALGGYPLIKQAMNQGYEVVEYILGNKVEPADEPLLQGQVPQPPGISARSNSPGTGPEATCRCSRTSRRCSCANSCSIPTSARRSRARCLRAQRLHQQLLLDRRGQVAHRGRRRAGKRVILKAGEFFGEMSLISGRRRTPPCKPAQLRAGGNAATVDEPADQLGRSGETRNRPRLHQRAIRALRAEASPAQMQDLVPMPSWRATRPATLFREGDEGDCLHLVRLRLADHLAQHRRARDRAVLCAGRQLRRRDGGDGRQPSAPPQRALPSPPRPSARRRRLQAPAARTDPCLRLRCIAEVKQRTAANLTMQAMPRRRRHDLLPAAQGVGEATDVLLIDESLCVAATTARRPAPKPTAAPRGWTARPARPSPTCTCPPRAATANTRTA
jgi:hypothetical protein